MCEMMNGRPVRLCAKKVARVDLLLAERPRAGLSSIAEIAGVSLSWVYTRLHSGIVHSVEQA